MQGQEPPPQLEAPFKSFLENPEMLAMLLEVGLLPCSRLGCEFRALDHCDICDQNLSLLGELPPVHFGCRIHTWSGAIWYACVYIVVILLMLLQERPPVVSFHFGLPDADTIESLRCANIMLLATATNPREARLVEEAGLHAIVAQGVTTNRRIV